MRSVLRRSRTARFAALAIASASLVILGSASPGDATTSPTVQAMQMPIPADHQTPYVHYGAPKIACGSPNSCVAVGEYTDTSTNWRIYIDTWNGTAWTTQEAPSVGGNAVSVDGVGCAGSICAAYGTYATQTGSVSYLLGRSAAGAWSAGAGSNITGVGCTQVGSSSACAAIGWVQPSNGSYSPTGVINVWNGASWSSVASHPPSDADGPDIGGQLATISCGVGAALCQATGYYNESPQTPGGPPSTALFIEAIDPIHQTASPGVGSIPLPGDAHHESGSIAYASLSGSGCASTGKCAAFGTYRTDPYPYTPTGLVVPLGGSGFTSQDPAGAPAGSLQSAACAAIPSSVHTYCVLGGSLSVSGTVGSLWEWNDSTVGGAWTQTNAPAPAGFGANQVFMPSISCGSSAFCIAGSRWMNNAGPPSGLREYLEVRVGTTWSGQATEYMFGAQDTPVFLQSTSCDSGSSCWGVGDSDVYGANGPVAVHVSLGSVTPPPPPGVTSAQVSSWFHSALAPVGSAARIGNLLRARGFNATFNISRVGTLKVTWTSTKGVIATAQKVFTRSGRYVVKIALTRLGQGVLSKARSLTIKTSAAYTVSGHPAVLARGQITLRR